MTEILVWKGIKLLVAGMPVLFMLAGIAYSWLTKPSWERLKFDNLFMTDMSALIFVMVCFGWIVFCPVSTVLVNMRIRTLEARHIEAARQATLVSEKYDQLVGKEKETEKGDNANGH